MISRIVKIISIPIIVFILAVILIPRSYIIPGSYNVNNPVLRAGTQYWNLPTGSRIAYTHIKANGHQQPYPIIFLQGGPGGPIYDQNILTLSSLADAGFDVYLYDQIGCGNSERLANIEEYTVDRHRLDLEAIVNIIGTEKIILIGQSWGSMLATEYLAFNTTKVDKVIFTGPGYILPENQSLREIKAPDSLNLRSPQYTNRQGRRKIYNWRTNTVEFCAKLFNVKLASDKEMDAFETLLDHEMSKSTVCDTSVIESMDYNKSGYYSMIKTVQSFNSTVDIRTKLKNCKVPALIMKGQCDGIKWGYITEFLELFNNHKLIIVPGAGHSISREQPELYIKYISDFLKDT